MELQDFFKEHPKAAIAFSGGVDSTYLLAEALRLGADVKPYCAVTAFQPAFEKREAAALCSRLGAALTTVELDVLADPVVTSNPPDRCYHCKKTIFSALMDRAAADGYTLMLDGTNASDDALDRPGMRALREFGVLSPLRICGLTKAEIRRRSPLTHASPPASPPGRSSTGISWPRWRGRKRRCWKWAIRIFACAIFTARPGCSCLRRSGSGPAQSGGPSAKPCSPGLRSSCWIWRRDKWRRRISAPC